MKSYTVHEPPDPPADRMERAERVVFIKDGFSWVAAIFTPLWMLAHRLWWALLGYVVAVAVVALAGQMFALNQDLVGLVLLALHLLAGFEADTLRRWSLERRGWTMLGAASGRNLAECERRFFEGWLPTQPVIAPAAGRADTSRRQWPVIGSLLGARS